MERAYAYPENERLTYRQLNQKGNQFANALLEKNINHGDRIMLMCDNSAEAMICKLGIAKAGAVSVPVNTMMPADVISYLIENTNPSFIISDEEYFEEFNSAILNSAYKNKIDLMIPIGNSSLESTENIVNFNQFIQGKSVEAPEVKIHGDDIWEILPTSGTTSMPKQVMISHQYTYLAGFAYGIDLATGLHLPTDLKIVSFLPITYHVGGHTLPTAAFLYGGTMILGRQQNVKELVQCINHEAATSLWLGQASAAENLAQEMLVQKEEDYSSLKIILYGYSALKPETDRLLKEICGNDLQFVQTFAQSEVIAPHHFFHSENYDLYRATAPDINIVGRPAPTLAAKVVNEEGNTLSEVGKVGEAVYRSPISFSGYYKNESATETALKDGWFHSGDLVEIGPNQRAIWYGRSKDMIKSGGENVSSQRIENRINQHPKVENSVVIGIPHEKWGEEVTAVVVLKENNQLSSEELIRYCRTYLAGYETPKKIYFIDEFPTTVADKVQKYKLVESILSSKKEQNE